jgi:thioredoxin reductase (NADPH)
MDNHYEVIILGGGAAGLTAGIYLSRSRVKTLILNEGIAGGQMILTHEIANYPGVESVSGYQLGFTMKKQAESFGCHVEQNIQIDSLELSGKEKIIQLKNGSVYSATALIIATGGRARRLGVEGEDIFQGRGISYCATCDGDFFTGKEIVVVGGGNSALEEALSLTKYASKITLIHQFKDFQAYPYAIEEARKHPKIHFMLQSTVEGFYGNEKLEELSIKKMEDGSYIKLKADGAFILIGYVPNAEKFKSLLKLSPAGEIITDENMATSIPGVFAAGDVRQKKVRQITTAVGDGTIAAIQAIEYIN